MTTEVLRNMLYADSDLLTDLAYVVMDEVHYLADRFRGAVWEEVIIHLPPEVRMVSLSATVSNAEEFGDWLQAVRGDTDVIVSEERPVPLEQHVLMRLEAHRPVRLVRAWPRPTGSTRSWCRWPATAAGRSSSRQMRDVGRYHSKGGRPDSVPDGPRRPRRAARRPQPAAGDLLHLQPRRAATRRSGRCCARASG